MKYLISSIFRLPFAFVTDDVVKATCLCLLAQASDAEKSHASEEEIERLVLQEFSRCLVKIIDCANKTKGEQKIFYFKIVMNKVLIIFNVF